MVTRGILGQPTRLIWHTETDITDIQILVLPGGFSYGDYLRCGAIARFAPILRAAQDHVRQGKQLVGICNGFQILLEAGFLPGALIRNRHLRFLCQPAPLRIENTQTPWTHLYSQTEITLPIAHGEGCYFCDPDTLKHLQDQHQIVFRYTPSAANGSLENIAGICNPERTILGLMPHPERATDPRLQRFPCTPSTDGLPFWKSLVAAVEG
jgi:phosphoribosylformylglycinamidine synthase